MEDSDLYDTNTGEIKEENFEHSGELPLEVITSEEVKLLKLCF